MIFEAVYTLQRTYRLPEAAIRAALLPLLELPGIVLPGKRRHRRVFDLYITLNISFADAYHAVLMQQLKLTDVVSFDREFDRVPGSPVASHKPAGCAPLSGLITVVATSGAVTRACQTAAPARHPGRRGKRWGAEQRWTRPARHRPIRSRPRAPLRPRTYVHPFMERANHHEQPQPPSGGWQ